MKGKILVTDSLFIFDEHIKNLESAGYEVERLDKPKATEKELIKAIKGKTGYILGGVESVTENVINAADMLKAIVFTGTGWDGFIPAHQYAKEKGIKIGSALHLNAYAVAEFGFTMTLAMVRELFLLSRGYEAKFKTTKSMADLSIGIVGLGHVGTNYARMCKGMNVKEIMYVNRHQKPEAEKELGVKKVELDHLFANADVVFVALPVGAGNQFVNAGLINSMKPGAIMVTIADEKLFDLDALYKALANKKITAAFDENIEQDRFHELPLNTWYTPNASTAFNTVKTIQEVSDCSVKTLLNLLETGEDEYRVV